MQGHVHSPVPEVSRLAVQLPLPRVRGEAVPKAGANAVLLQRMPRAYWERLPPSLPLQRGEVRPGLAEARRRNARKGIDCDSEAFGEAIEVIC